MNDFLFSHILLAHFIADYPLQTDKLFSVKMEQIYGAFFHGTLLFLVIMLLVFPLINNPIVTLGCFIIVVLHIFQDELKIFFTKKWKEGENFFYFLADQGLHIFIIFLFSLFPIPDPKIPDNSIVRLFHSSSTSYCLVFYISVTYGLWILLYSIETTFLKKNDLPKGFRKYYGFIERGATFTLFLVHPVLGFLGFGFLIFRHIVLSRDFSSNFREGALGIFLTIILGFLFKGIV